MGGKFKGVHISGVPGYRGQAGKRPLAPGYRPEEPKEPENPKKPERTVAKGKTARPDFNQAKESGMKGLYMTRPQPSSRECFDKYLEETKDEPLARQYLAITKEIDDTIALQGLSSIAESKELGKKLVGLRLKKIELERKIKTNAEKQLRKNNAEGEKPLKEFANAFEAELLKTAENSSDFRQLMEAPLDARDFSLGRSRGKEMFGLVESSAKNIISSLSADEAVALSAGIHLAHKALSTKNKKAFQMYAAGGLDEEAKRQAAHDFRLAAMLGATRDMLTALGDKNARIISAISRMASDAYSDKKTLLRLAGGQLSEESNMAFVLGSMEIDVLRAEDATTLYNSARPLKTTRAEKEIIAHVGSRDRKGSCVSQALAYTAQKLGFDVTDLQDGSRLYFAGIDRYFIQRLGELAVAHGHSNCFLAEEDFSGGKGAYNRVAKRLESVLPKGSAHQMIACIGTRGKGGHCAIIRRNPQTDAFEYLELQDHSYNNGWKPLSGGPGSENAALDLRFGAGGRKLYIAGLDIDVLKDDDIREVFRVAVGYLNTRKYGGGS